MTSKKKITLNLRPITKGIVQNLPPNAVPKGALLDTEGALMFQRGVGRRSGITELFTVGGGVKYFRFLAYYVNDVGYRLIVFIDDLGVFHTFDTLTGADTIIGGGYPELRPDEEQIIDHVQYLNYFIFTDNHNSPMVFDGSTITEVGGTSNIKCKTLTVLHDRLYMGYISWTGSVPSGWIAVNTSMLTWSEIPGDINSMNPENIFLHIPYADGTIEKLHLLGSTLVVYFTFGVMIGRQTTIAGYSLPISFDRFDTGNRGVNNVKAVASATDGNFFIARDNIYILRGDFSMPAISEAVSEAVFLDNILNFKSRLLNSPNDNYLYVLTANANMRGFNTIWVLNTFTKAWSKLTLIIEENTLVDFTNAERFESFDPVTSTFVSIDPLLTFADAPATTLADKLAFTVGPTLYAFSPLEYVDTFGPVQFNFVTADFDLDIIDGNKTFTKLSVKIAETSSLPITFEIDGSVDQGVNWRNLGNITIPPNEIEGYVSFLLTGPMARFRVSSHSETLNYIVTELGIQVKARGPQADNLV